MQVGIHGKCQSNYATELDGETKELKVTRVIDVNNCREKAVMYTGMASAVLDNTAKQVCGGCPLAPRRLAVRHQRCFCVPLIQKGESVISMVRDLYTVKPTADGGLVTRARGLERQFFSPFNVKGGNFKMEAV